MTAGRVGLLVACVAAPVCLGGLVGAEVVSHPGRAIVGWNPSSDFQIMAWSLRWWPWALGHGVDPIRTAFLWAPGGFSTLWITAIPAVALLASPLTLAFGPLVAYNVLMFAAVALAAGCAYLLCRELTGRAGPALLGGLVFGLSPYMVGHTMSQHLNLTFVWPIPLIAWAIVRRLRGRWASGRSFVVVVAGLLVVELGSSLELFLDLSLLLGLALVIALIAGGAMRREAARTGALVGCAYGLALPAIGAVAWLGLTTPHSALPFPPASYSLDLANLVVPTRLTLLGVWRPFGAISRDFVGNLGEQDGYLGVPLIAVALLAGWRGRRQGAGLALVLLLAVVCLSLGPLLAVAGRPVAGSPLSTAHVPLLGDILPARLSLFAMLLAACLAAVWLAGERQRWLRLAVSGLIVASLTPNFLLGRAAGAWGYVSIARFSTARAPAGFVDAPGWSRLVRPGENVLVLPAGARTAALYWQAQSEMRFRLAVAETPFVPRTLEGDPTVTGLVDATLPVVDGDALAAARLRAFLLRQRVGAVVVGEQAGARWRRIAAAATGARPLRLAGSLVYQVPAGLRPLHAAGEVVVVGARPHRVTAWIRYDGRRGRLEVETVSTSARALSSPAGDAEEVAAAASLRGRAAVAFTESRNGSVLLRVATEDRAGSWRVRTLDRRRQPIWSPHLAVGGDGTILAAWVDESGPERLVRAALETPGGRWRPAVTLESGDGIATALAAARGAGAFTVAWSDRLAHEERVRVATLGTAGWQPPISVGTTSSALTGLRLDVRGGVRVLWRTRGVVRAWLSRR